MTKHSVVPFVDRDDAHWIRIDEGKFKGIRYTYGPIALSEKESADGSLPVSFSYLLDGGQDIKPDDLPLLEAVMGEILHTILLRMSAQADNIQEETDYIDIPDTGE
jgi:hypothetical protein